MCTIIATALALNFPSDPEEAIASVIPQVCPRENIDHVHRGVDAMSLAAEGSVIGLNREIGNCLAILVSNSKKRHLDLVSI